MKAIQAPAGQISLAGMLIASVAAFIPATAGAQDVASVSEIIVTAQRREQDILEVGANVTAVGATDVRRQRMEQVTDFAQSIANVNVKEISPGTLPIITIRGIGLNDWSATNNPSAGIYVHEVYVSSLALMNFDLFDIQRLEALKGPQGTLYGRNSTAGALNILTARPKFDGASGFAAGSIGNYKTATAEGWINLPVSETVAVRLSGKLINQDQGFFYNAATDDDLGARDVLLGRAQIRWKPNEALDMNLKVEGQRVRSEAGASAFWGARPPATPIPGLVCPGGPQCANPLGYSDADGDPYTGSFSVDPTYDLDQLSTTLTANLDLGWATLTSVTGHVDFKRQWGADVDASPAAISDYVERDKISQFSQEVRLSGEQDQLIWILGAFYSNDQVKGIYDGSLPAMFRANTFTSWDQNARSSALFGNLEYALSPSLSLVAGMRHTWEEKENLGYTDDLANICPSSLLSGALCGRGPVRLASIDAKISDRNWSWRLGLNWRPVEDILVYGSISQGVKSGGFFAGFATTSTALRPYRPETLVAYEAGVKGRIAAAGLSWTASVFYYDYADMQTFIRDTSGPIPVQRLGNVEEATLYGLDLDLHYQPPAIDGLSLTAGLGLLETELGAFPSSGGVQPAGAEAPNAPGASFNVGTAYEFPVNDNWSARLQTNGRYTGETWKDAQNLPILRADAFWVWDARAGVESADGWDLSLWVKNLADERYVTHAVSLLSLGFGSRVYGPPRTYGISASRTF